MSSDDNPPAPVIGVIFPAALTCPDWLPPSVVSLWRCRQIVSLSVTCAECGARRGRRCEPDANGNQWSHYVRIKEGITYAGADHLLRVQDRSKDAPRPTPADPA